MKKALNINPELTTKMITSFIREKVLKAGFGRIVMGLSGGLDSTVVAHLAVKALGREGVVGIVLPYRTVRPETINDAEGVGRDLGIKYTTIDITPMVEAYLPSDVKELYLRKGNFMARMRMAVLYDQSVIYRALVLGTSNKTELLLGYGTIYGDLGVSLQPLGDLYKTQVYELAQYLGVKQNILKKVPTADLYPGQTDEGDLGATYAEMDKILFHLVELKESLTKLKQSGFNMELVQRLKKRILQNRFKSCLPPIAKLS